MMTDCALHCLLIWDLYYLLWTGKFVVKTDIALQQEFKGNP